MSINSGIVSRQRKNSRLFSRLVTFCAFPLILAISAFVCPTVGGGGTQGPGTTINGGTRGAPLAPNVFTQLHMFDAKHGWATSPNHILTTSDGGEDWTNVTPVEWLNAFNGTPTSDPNSASGIIAQSYFLNARVGWIASLSRNNVTPPVVTPGQVPSMTSTTQKVYVLATIDGGTTWMAAHPIDVSGVIKVMRPYFVDENEGWLEVGVTDGTTESSFNGASGTPPPLTDPGEGIRVYHSVDGGITWGDPIAATQALPTPGPTKSPVVRPCTTRACAGGRTSTLSGNAGDRSGLPAIINVSRKRTQASSNSYSSDVTSAQSNTYAAQQTQAIDGPPPTDGLKNNFSAMVNCIVPQNLTVQQLLNEINTPHCPTPIPALTTDTQGCTVTGTNDTLLWTTAATQNERWLSTSSDSGANWSAPTDGLVGQIDSVPPGGTPGGAAESIVSTDAPIVLKDGSAIIPIQTQLYPNENSARSSDYSLALEYFHLNNGGGGGTPASLISTVSSVNSGAPFNVPLLSSQQDLAVVNAGEIWAAGTAYDDTLGSSAPPQLNWNIYQRDPGSPNWKKVGGQLPQQLTTISILDVIADGTDAAGHATGYDGWAVDGPNMYSLTMDASGAVTAWNLIYSYASPPTDGSPVSTTPIEVNGTAVAQKIPKDVPGKIVQPPASPQPCAGANNPGPGGPFVPIVTGAQQTINDIGITSYGFNDNSGQTESQYSSSTIAYPRNQGYPTAHNITVEGTGTYTNPITAAAPPRDTKAGGLMPPGTMIYVPFLQKYFIMEDLCGDTDPQGCNQGAHHLDLFMGPSVAVPQQYVPQLDDCEGRITYPAGQKTVIVNPPNNETVDQTLMFQNNTCTVVQH